MCECARARVYVIEINDGALEIDSRVQLDSTPPLQQQCCAISLPCPLFRLRFPDDDLMVGLAVTCGRSSPRVGKVWGSGEEENITSSSDPFQVAGSRHYCLPRYITYVVTIELITLGQTIPSLPNVVFRSNREAKRQDLIMSDTCS